MAEAHPTLVARISDTVFGWMETVLSPHAQPGALRFQGFMLIVTVATLAALGLALCGGAERFLPDGGYRLSDRHAEDACPIPASPQLAPRRRSRSSAIIRKDQGRGLCALDDGRWRQWRLVKHGAVVHRAEAAGQARCDGASRWRGSLKRETAVIPGIDAYYQAVQNIQIGGRSGQCRCPVHAAERRSQHPHRRQVPGLVDRLKKRPELRDVTTDLELSNP